MASESFSFRAMACACEVVVASEDARGLQPAAQAAIAEVQRIEHKFSRYRADSVISRINAQAGLDWVQGDEELAQLLAFAAEMHRLSGGLFDITSGVLRQVWDFSSPPPPSDAALAPVLPLINGARVQVDGTAVMLPEPGMALDLGGLGKEYAVDRAVVLLQQAGVQSGYVNLGGDVRVLGPKLDGSAWRMGVRHPREAAKLVTAVPLTSGALATSGDYQRYVDWAGQRHCHVLNPRTGRSVQGWQSVSVLAPQAIAAGCMATIAMLKETQALAFLDGLGVAYFAVDGEGATHQSLGSVGAMASTQGIE